MTRLSVADEQNLHGACLVHPGVCVAERLDHCHGVVASTRQCHAVAAMTCQWSPAWGDMSARRTTNPQETPLVFHTPFVVRCLPGRGRSGVTLSGAEVERIEFGVQRLFAFVAEGLLAVTDAFVRHDTAAAANLMASEPVINAMHLDVEDLAQELLVRRRDLTDADIRLLISVIRVAPELERSGDLIEHIATRTGVVSPELRDDIRSLIAEMGDLAAAMWRAAAVAWTERDPEVVSHLRHSDDVMDDLHAQLTERLGVARLSTCEAIELGLVARFFERLGDHAVNVTRRVRFLAEATAPEFALSLR